MDPGVTPDARYQPTATAPLDSLTGLLLLAGIGLAAWKMPSRALPLAALLVPLVGSQLVSPRGPTLGDAMVALPALYLLVAESLDRLVLVLPFPSVTRAVLLAAIRPTRCSDGRPTLAGSGPLPVHRPASRPSTMTRSTPGSASSGTPCRHVAGAVG